jgi:pimeloyl-ACP methyl ester carboxylesterase
VLHWRWKKRSNFLRSEARHERAYLVCENARLAWKEYRQKLKESLAEDRRGDAAALFLTLVGMPADQVDQMRREPWWAPFETVAPTLAYDAAVLGEDRAMPVEKAARVSVPAIVMNGSASEAFMYDTALALAKAMPNAQHWTLEGQTHAVTPEAIAPVLVEFFAG